MKKIKALFLIIAMVVTFLASYCQNVYAEQSQLDKIIAFAKSKIGSTEYVGRCQAFVYQCYKAGGIDNGSASSAIAAWGKYGVSTSRTDIPIGACVYFNENVGSIYGHVGLYIGDNKMIHSRASVGEVVESTLTWYFNNNCYLGWGWQGGVQPSGSVSPSTPTNAVYLVGAPDGFQALRTGASTSYSKICNVPNGTYITVTKIANDGSWNWGYTTYNGQTGWVCLYYTTKHTHSYGAWQTVTAAKCTTAGSQKRTCACGAVETATISAIGHSYSSTFTVDKSASCTVAGSKSKHCTRSGCSATTEVTAIPKTSHSYGSWQTAASPTCSDSGLQKHVCTSCSLTEYKTIAALGHSYSSSWTTDKAASCTTAGSKSRHCTRSGCTATTAVTVIPPTGHSYGSWQTVAKPSCTATGSQKHVCTSCSHTEYKTVAALGHDYSSAWTVDTAASCTASGTKSHHCSRCTARSSVTTIPANGHSWSGWTVTKKATYEETGLKVRECTVNGCSAEESSVIAKLPLDGHTHNFGEWVTETAATCVVNGVQKRTCSICKSFETQQITARGHKVSEWKVEKVASCTDEGVETRSCTVCHESETHVTPAHGHSFGEWRTKTEASAESEGLLERKCNNCSETETQTTPKLNISVDTSSNTPSEDTSSRLEPNPEPNPEPEADKTNGSPKDSNGLTTAIIICSAIIGTLLAALIVVIILKKK